MRTDGRTDMTKPIDGFRNFANASRHVPNLHPLRFVFSVKALPTVSDT